MRYKIIVPLLLASCLWGQGMFAQTIAPKYSNEFLAIGVGARALAMGNAQVAVVDDATAGYWNPAGLLAIKSDHSLSLMHAEYFAGIAKYDYAGFATKIDSSSVLALTAIRFGVDDIPDTRFLYDANGVINFDNIRFFSAADYAFMLSYARKVPALKGLRLGGGVKVVHRNVGKFANAWGFGLDAGAQYLKGNWAFGLMLRDVTTTFNAWTHNSELLQDVYAQTGNEIPETSLELTLPRMILGAARNFSISEKFNALVSADLITTFDGKRNVLLKSNLASFDPQFGLELAYEELVYLRGGVRQLQQLKDFDGTSITSFKPSGGVGVRIQKLVIEYALTNIGSRSSAPYSHVFSLKANLNKKDE